MASVSPKVLAAISGAIHAYIQDEEAVLAAAQAAVAPPPPPPANLWGLSGRQSMMQMRQLIQRRGLK
ncbi:MAG: hypothetical protein ACUVXF_10560 [Desulfobaccales bacterium]